MKKTLTQRQTICLIISFLLGNTLALTGGVVQNEKYGYMTYLPAFGLFLILILIYSYIYKKNSYEDFFDIIESLRPKIISKIILFIIFLYSLMCAVLSCGNFMFFASVSMTSQINTGILSVFTGICIFFVLSANKKTLGRYCELIFPFVIFLIGIMLIFGLFKGNIKNLYIDLPISIKTFLKSTLFNFISPFSNIFMIFLFMKNVADNRKIIKNSIIAASASGIILMLVYFINLLILGKNLLSDLFYPTLFSFGVINPGFFTQRSETIYYISYIFFDIIYVCISLFVCINAFILLFMKDKIISENKKRILTSVSSLILIVFMIFFDSAEAFYEMYSYFAIIQSAVTILIPLTVFILA